MSGYCVLSGMSGVLYRVHNTNRKNKVVSCTLRRNFPKLQISTRKDKTVNKLHIGDARDPNVNNNFRVDTRIGVASGLIGREGKILQTSHLW